MAILTWDQLHGDTASDQSPSHADRVHAASGQNGGGDQLLGSLRSAISDAYTSSLGRSITEPEYTNWIKSTGNASAPWTMTDPMWAQSIANSPEAQAYRAKQTDLNIPKPPGGYQGYNPNGPQAQIDPGWFQQTFGAPGTPGELNALEQSLSQYGIKVLRNAAGVAGKIQYPTGQVVDIIKAAGAGGQGFQWLPEGGPADTSTAYGNSASTQLYVNEILARLEALRQPVNDPMLPLLQSLALQRVNSLQGDPYTAGDNAALIAKYQQPLTDARDAELQRRKEELSARNIGPSSGLYQQQLADVGSAYTKGVAGISNNLAVQAIDEKNRRAQEALSILASLVGAGQQQRSEVNAQANDLLRVAALLPGLDESRLQLLLQASGDPSANTSLSALTSLAGLSQNASAQNSLISQQNAEAMGAYIANIIASMGKKAA